MDINEEKIKEEVTSFVQTLQKLLPKKKEIILFEAKKTRQSRLGDVHSEAKNVFPRCFIGSKILVLREIVNQVKLLQQYNYGKSKENYRCFIHLLHRELEEKDVQDGMVVDSTGSATAVINKKLDRGYNMRLTSRIRDLVSSDSEVVFEKENEGSHGSLTCLMRDVDPNTLKVVTQWLYRLTPEFSMGTEVGLKPLTGVATLPELSLSARYERPAVAISTTVSRTGFQVCLYKQFAPDLRLATIWYDSNRNGTTSVALGVHKIYKNGSELKVFVDSNRCGGFTYQRDVLFQEGQEVRVLRLVGSTLIDHQRRVRFGIGFHLDF